MYIHIPGLIFHFFIVRVIEKKLAHLSWKECVCSDWDKFLQIVLLKKNKQSTEICFNLAEFNFFTILHKTNFVMGKGMTNELLTSNICTVKLRYL